MKNRDQESSLSLELEAMRAGRDCASALAETAWHGCRLRCGQLIAAHDLIARMASALELGSPLVAEAAALRSEADIESLVVYPPSREYETAMRRIEADADVRCGRIVDEARRDPGHPLHKFVVWVRQRAAGEER